MTTPATPFAITGPLPTEGLTSIGASAGTGKTFAIAALATRFVVEQDCDISDLLVLTFTRSAASELRDRIRIRLKEVADHLGADTPPPTSDELLTLLASQPADVIDDYRRRAASAVEKFDSATIGTIHSFCSAARSLLGATAGINADAQLSTDTDDVVTQACTDAVAAAGLQPDVETLPKPLDLIEATRTVLRDPTIELVPGDTNPETNQATAALAPATADEVRRRLHDSGVMSFDTMVSELAAAVTDPNHGPTRAATLAKRFPVVLLDEFQDTDGTQWTIFESMLNAAPPPTMVVVGDPKQAIYAFRGGDIHAYLRAVERPGTTHLFLDTNHRCDAPMVEALNDLFAGKTFGADRIGYHSVNASATNSRRLEIVNGDHTHHPASIDIRTLNPESVPLQGTGLALRADPARDAMHEDLARQVSQLTTCGWLVDAAGDRRQLNPGDVAVLIGAHANGPKVQAALSRHGVPSVITGGQDISETDAARQWAILIAALERPSDPRRARAAALSWWWGWDEQQLAGASDKDITDIQVKLGEHVGRLRRRGLAPVLARIVADNNVVTRLVSTPGGLRNVTDLTHLGELLDNAVGGRGCAPASLAAALANMRAAAGTRSDDDDTKRRTETDAAAVRIMTMHAAKGLEFPVVCCPDLWGNARPASTYQHDGRRRFTVGPGSPDKAKKEGEAQKEGVGEQQRLGYVALTRARHLTLMWWTKTASSDSPSIDLLFGKDLINDRSDKKAQLIGFNNQLVDRFSHSTHINVTVVGATSDTNDEANDKSGSDPHPAPDGRPPAPVTLAAAELGHTPETRIRRWSFTVITADTGGHTHTNRADNPAEADGPTVAADPNDDSIRDGGSGDEPVDGPRGSEALPAPDPRPDAPGVSEPLFAHDAAGANFGTLVHEVLENIDFVVPDGDLHAALHREVKIKGLDKLTDPDRLVEALAAAIDTPLGGPPDTGFGDLRLRNIPRSDRLDELRFELPLGDPHRRCTNQPRRRPTLAMRNFIEVITSHLDDDDPVGNWARSFAPRTTEIDIGGFLTGSIDLVLRYRQPDGTMRYSAVDYKTNRLDPPAGDTTLAAYHPSRLGDAMAKSDYPLQALLYAVALHRYLRWRVVGYDPAQHLGPVGYLFLRGMVGPHSPQTDGMTSGVFVWQPPTTLVTSLSDLLHDGLDLTGAAR